VDALVRDGSGIAPAVALSLAALLAGAAPARAGRMADYMVMQLCTDAAGKVLPGVAPIDAACLARRAILPGEAPTYRLRDWPPLRGGCHDGLTVKYNLPVQRHGVTRIVSFADRASGAGCDAGGDDASAETARGVSVQWHDDGFAFIMGSWSPVGVSQFESPLCRTAKGGSGRFYRGWVLAPATLPPPRQPGWDVFPSHLANAAGADDPCPTVFNAGLTLWVVDDMAFRAARLNAVISHHFARSGANGASPGAAQQVERSYWTQEFGLTRWEKWAREDWVHPRSHRPAPALAAALFARGRCNPPYALPAAVTPRLRTEKLTGDGAWRQVLIDPVTGERHAWVMTLCADYTNIARTPPADSARLDDARLDDAFWRAGPDSDQPASAERRLP
jgi:hypothetical protein